jgi:hypothetical protein
MAPAVTPAAQVRWPRAPVGPQGHWHLGQRQPGEPGAHHHLGGELHPRALQPQADDRVAAEGTQAAMEVVNRCCEEQAPNSGEDRVADPAVLPGHGARQDAPAACREAAAHDQVRAGPQTGQEPRQFAEVVGAVGVAHQHEPAAGGGDAASQRVAVAACRDFDNPCPGRFGQRLRAVGAAIVRDNDLARDAGGGEGGRSLGYAPRYRRSFVEAGHEDGQLQDGLVANRRRAFVRTLKQHRPRSPAGPRQCRNLCQAAPSQAPARGCHGRQSGL